MSSLTQATAIKSAIALPLMVGLGMAVVHAANGPERIIIDYPLNESVFPPNFAPPTFLWRDPSPEANIWKIDVSFAEDLPAIHLTSKGERLQVGEIDKRCISITNKLPELTPEQAAAHTWKPDAATWASIEKRAGAGPVTISIRGYANNIFTELVSSGAMRIHVSADPVDAPIFYRDVPLMPSETEKGFIKPLASGAVPLIAWRMRNLNDSSSHVVMTGLHTCANCHSFSGDGKTLGLDMDGPQNDKGLYAMVPVRKKMVIRDEDMISWSSFPTEAGSPVRVGFMSQVSPDGHHVVTTIRPHETTSSQFYYVANFKDYRFLQVFYPTRGILAWYDRDARKLRPLPGADDPRYVQASAVWSPDGKYLVFARAEAKDPFPADGNMAAYANDPAEVPIQYDLYRIPFNDGKGGVAEPIQGASRNGMSNSFAKVSPDGKWIVFVQAHNGQLMRPDGQLYIVPAAGGQARRMTCNTALMNSWHSFSPNSRWLVFSSKSRSPYTQLFLTHIDADGNDTPAILIENSTAANRAANIPEFVNVEPSGIQHIATPAVEFYAQFDMAADLAKSGQYGAAVPEWIKAISMSPGDARVHNSFGQTLARLGKTQEAIAEFRKALSIKTQYPEAENNLGMALAGEGFTAGAIESYRKALADSPRYSEAHNNLGLALLDNHQVDTAIGEFREALAINSGYSQAHNNLGFALASTGHLDEAAEQYRQAIELDTKYADAYNNLGSLQARQGKIDEAIADFSKSVELDGGNAGAQRNLGHALLLDNHPDQAVPHLEKALELSPKSAELCTELGAALVESGHTEQAIAKFEEALQLSPNMVEAHSYLGMVLVLESREAEGLAHWRRALATDPDNLQVLNETAWFLATSPNALLRNGNEATSLAEHAVQLTSGRDPVLLGTLAAAYAETGAFDRALQLEQRATDLASQEGKTQLATTLGSRSELFRAKTPIRQP